MPTPDDFYLYLMAETADADGWAPSWGNYMREAAKEILYLRDQVQTLISLGDAIVTTGGQQGFDNAIDQWQDYRERQPTSILG